MKNEKIETHQKVLSKITLGIISSPGLYPGPPLGGGRGERRLRVSCLAKCFTPTMTC